MYNINRFSWKFDETYYLKYNFTLSFVILLELWDFNRIIRLYWISYLQMTTSYRYSRWIDIGEYFTGTLDIRRERISKRRKYFYLSIYRIDTSSGSLLCIGNFSYFLGPPIDYTLRVRTYIYIVLYYGGHFETRKYNII